MAFSIRERLIIDPELPVTLPRRAIYSPGPVCVGGVGGSGTRVVATLLESMGYFVGNNINAAKDNFDIPLNKVLKVGNDPQQVGEIICNIFEKFEEKMHRDSPSNNWAWKVPGSFYWLDYTNYYFPEVRYIHLLRNGLDMAYSDNKNQVGNWGRLFGIHASETPTAREMLQFWITVNRFAIEKARRLLQERFLIVKFDDLCRNPEIELEKMTEFLSLELSAKQISDATAVIEPPESLQRYKCHDIEADFGEDLIRDVVEFGFPVVIDS